MLNILFEIFLCLLTISGILFLILVIWTIATTPLRNKKERLNEEFLNQILQETLNELKEEEKLKKTTKKTRTTKKKEDK